MSVEWDDQNFKRFLELFGLSSGKKMPVGKRHRIVIAAHMKKLIKMKTSENASSKDRFSFSKDFFSDFREYCSINHLIYNDVDVRAVFPNRFDPYANTDMAIRYINTEIRSRTINKGRGSEPHEPYSITWSQFYDHQMNSNKGLISLYEDYFKKNKNFDDQMIHSIAIILFQKCFYSAMKDGEIVSSGGVVDKGSGQFQVHGINILAAKHNRGDYAQGEKVAISLSLKSFCLEANDFKVNGSNVEKFLEKEMEWIHRSKPDYLRNPITIDEEIGIDLGFSFSKIANEKEFLVLKEIKETLNTSTLSEVEYSDVRHVVSMSIDEFELFKKSKFKIYEHGHSAMITASTSFSMTIECLDSYYSDLDVVEIMEEEPEDLAAWALTIDDLAEEILIKCFPLEKQPKYSNPSIFMEAKRYLSNGIPTGYSLVKENGDDFVIKTTN